MSEEMVEKYREGFDAMAATSVRLAEMVKKGDERIRELEAALDSDPDGSGYWRFWSKKASEQAERAASSQARLSEAVKVLERIERWRGEFPRTGKFYPSADGAAAGNEMSYGACYGSNGERDYMRSLAKAFLATLGEET